MLKQLLQITILLAQYLNVDTCTPNTYPYCQSWGTCSKPCGGGQRSRICKSCLWGIDKRFYEDCNTFCKYGHPYYSKSCHCPSWRTGECCETCRHIYIAHCVSGQKACGGSPDGIKCTKCYDPYFPAGYGNGCQECPSIGHCIRRHCTTPSNTKCLECEDNNVFFKKTTGDSKCERLCSFNNHYCWPGHCSEDLTKNCACAKGFKLVQTVTETSCQPVQSPEIETCNTVATGPIGEKRRAKSRTSSTACKYLDDMYGNFQLTQFSTEMVSSFFFDVSNMSRPKYIHEERFGITDTTVYIERKLLNGVNKRLSTHHQLIDTRDSRMAMNSHKSRGNFSVNQTLTNGEALCVIFEAYGGGYLKHVNFASKSNEVSSPVPYRKVKGTREICYRFDGAKPQHCLATSTCHTEPITLQTRITRSQISKISFDGWFDSTPPGGKKVQASGIESYQVTVNKVLPSKGNLKVDTGIVLTKKVNGNESMLSMSLNLTSDRPCLYSITLEVKDFADNTHQARRFMLYDNTSYIETWPENHFRVTSASQQSNFTWQTHHHDICLSWKDYFLNRFYMENELLNPIEPDPFGKINGVYEQLSGTLPVSGTPNVYGITKFLFSSSLNGGKFSNETEIPNFLSQSYCNDFKVKDGQTYTLLVRPVDIANNTISENRTVHVDRSAPYINNIWLRKDGNNTQFVHHMTDFSTMHLYFEALDPHSGIRNIEWTFGRTEFGIDLIAEAISVTTLPGSSCPKNILKCYCPDVGNCEFFNYTIPLNKLIAIKTHDGNRNISYFFTVTVTNHAFLTNIEHIDILVEDSGEINKETTRHSNTAQIAAGVSSLGVIVVVVIAVIFLRAQRQKIFERCSRRSQMNSRAENAMENVCYNISRDNLQGVFDMSQNVDSLEMASNSSQLYDTLQRKDDDTFTYATLSPKTEDYQFEGTHQPDDKLYENLKLTK